MNGRSCGLWFSSHHGFTLIELSEVIAVIGIISMSVVPMYGTTIQRAKETALKENLFVMRKVLDQYYKDHEKWPEELGALVREGYLRAIPVDPLTNNAQSWIPVPSEPGGSDIYDVRSGADGASLDSIPFREF